MLDFFTRSCIDGFKKTRPHIDGFFKPVNASTGFLTWLAENRFIKPVLANTGLFNLSY